MTDLKSEGKVRHDPRKEFVLSALGIKRKIGPPFQICGSRESLEWLRKCIDAALDDKFIFGWVEVPLPLETHLINTKPKEWDEA